MKCPVCMDNCSNLASHFRFVHKFTTDKVINLAFERMEEINDRVSNLCELLEIKEK